MIDFFKSFRCSQAGLSLPELMLGGALLAGLGLAGAQMMRNQRLAQQRLDLDQRLNIFHQSILKKMSNSLNCNASLKHIHETMGPITAGTTIPELFYGEDPTGLKGNAGTTEIAEPMLSAGNYIDAGPNSTRTWMLNSITVVRTVSETGPLHLRMVYQLDPARFNPARRVTKDLLLNVRFYLQPASGTPQFMECFNPEESSVDNLQRDICKSLNYGGVSTTGVIAEWDEETQSCITQGSDGSKLKECGPGMLIEGITSNGIIHCRPVGALACPGGATPIFSGGKIICP